MITLPNTTLIIVDGGPLQLAEKALKLSFKDIKYNSIKLLSSEIKPNEYYIKDNIFYYGVPKMTWVSYNDFIIHKLNPFVDTNYCLLIQTDGFVLNPEKWNNEFFNYDFIGAPLSPTNLANSHWVLDNIRKAGNFNLVGNGGFCLRTKKLLEISEKAPFECNGPEDVYISVNHYKYFIDNGITFAPIELARTFSTDPLTPNTFGFHGNKGLINTIKL